MSMRAWNLALIGIAFGIVAAGSCAKVVGHGPYPGAERYELAFLVSGVLAGGPLVLLAFRLPRTRRQAWPSIRQVLLVAAASWVVMYASLIGFASLMNGPSVRRREMIVLVFALLVTSSAAAVVTLGGGALLAVGIVRRVRNPGHMR